MSEYPQAQIDLQNPLDDPNVSALYLSSNGSDPAVVAVKARVTAYYEALAGDSTPVQEYSPSHQESNLPMSTRGEFDRDTSDLEDDASEEQQPYSLAEDLSRDGYVGLGDAARDMGPTLLAALDDYGDRTTANVQRLCVAMGEDLAGQAFIDLEQIAAKHPDWQKSPRLRAQVVRLNQAIDSATVRIYNKLAV